jgi:hypothetical protein
MVQSPVLQTVFRKVRTIFALFLRACKNTCNFACGAAAKFLDMRSVAEPDAQLLEVVEKAIGAISQHLSTKTEEKGSITDLIRLLQLRRELEAEKPRSVSARWVEDECSESID